MSKHLIISVLKCFIIQEILQCLSSVRTFIQDDVRRDPIHSIRFSVPSAVLSAVLGVNATAGQIFIFN
jgi:hypothetical protein